MSIQEKILDAYQYFILSRFTYTKNITINQNYKTNSDKIY